MRVTLGILTGSIRASLAQSSSQLQIAQETAASGKRLHKPSDDVSGTGKAMSLRSALAGIDQLTRNADMVSSKLSIADSTLGNAVSLLQTVRSLAVSAGNAALTDGGRQSIAAQLDRISDNLVSAGNTQYLGKYIFAGSKTDTPPIEANASGTPPYIYAGDSIQMQVQVSPGNYVSAGVSGADIMNLNGSVPGSPDVFTMIKDLKEQVLAGNTDEISAMLVHIDANLSNVTAIRSSVGARLSNLEQTRTAIRQARINTAELLSATEDADIADAIIQLQTRQNVYQAALSVASKMLQMNLSDFIR